MAQPTSDRAAASAPPPVDYGRARRRSGGRLFATARTLVAAALLFVLAVLAYQRLSAPAPSPPPSRNGPIVTIPSAPAAPAPPRESERSRITRVYERDVVPLLDRYDERNRNAAGRAIATLHERIDARRAGVKPFIEDVQSWRTTFGVIGRKTRELWRRWWHDDRSAAHVHRYVDAKFQRHVLSAEGLDRDVQAALAVFREDVEASRNQLYAEIRLPLSEIKIEQVQSNATFDSFVEDVQARGKALGQSAGTDAVVSNLTAFAAGWVAGEVGMTVASRVTGMIVTRVGAQLATRAAISGGATVTGATAGGGTGSVAGPAGTVVGVAVGIAVGAVVDWWMSEKFEAKMTGQLNGFLSDLQRSLVDGTPGQPGLRDSFDEALKANSRIQRQAMIDTLLHEVEEK